MSIFTESDRIYLAEMRAITTDNQGQEVLVGLTRQETEFYMNYAKQRLEDTHRRDDAPLYLELHEKHERERMSILAAENQLRIDKPTLN
jgi:hypothetical protein